MNKKGFTSLLVIILVIIIAGIAAYVAIDQRIHTPSPSPTLSSISSPTPSQTPTDNMSVALGEKFTLKKNQSAKIGNTGLEITITEFYNSPCPPKAQCFWSGVGIDFEYHFNGEVKKGIDLVQAFGYQTKIVATDHTTYATLIVQKIQATVSQCLPSDITLNDIVSADMSGYVNGQPAGGLHKVTVEQELTELNAACSNGKLVDSSGREIFFYRLTGCWGNPPYNYQEILQKQQTEIHKLKERYTVIGMTCNPSGIPIP